MTYRSGKVICKFQKASNFVSRVTLKIAAVNNFRSNVSASNMVSMIGSDYSNIFKIRTYIRATRLRQRSNTYFVLSLNSLVRTFLIVSFVFKVSTERLTYRIVETKLDVLRNPALVHKKYGLEISIQNERRNLLRVAKSFVEET